MRDKVRCPNMNHGRLNAPVRFCPSCGEAVNKSARSFACDDTKHKAQRKERSLFCKDCGKNLAT